jgi:hypothetical protein
VLVIHGGPDHAAASWNTPEHGVRIYFHRWIAGLYVVVRRYAGGMECGGMESGAFSTDQSALLSSFLHKQAPFPVVLDMLREHPAFEFLLADIPVVTDEHRLG